MNCFVFCFASMFEKEIENIKKTKRILFIVIINVYRNYI